ncbi:hypothetical protein FRC17_008078, partial [Serendipita sp. 399]
MSPSDSSSPGGGLDDRTPTGTPRQSTVTLPSSDESSIESGGSNTTMESTFAWRDGKRYHRYPATDAPYPQSYDPTILELERSNNMTFNKICGGASLFAVDGIDIEPPKTVLDLGCGNGLWVMEAAKAWPETIFVGIDLVNLQPNLELVADDLRARIEWKHANFLDPLPFPASHFDLVHMRRIARGIPETKWPLLLKEVSRVLKPEGRLEIIEDDLSFPGGSERSYSSPRSPTGPSSRKGNNNDDEHERPSTPRSPTWDFFYNSDPRDHSRLEQA